MIRDWLPKSCHSPGDGSDGPAWPWLPSTRWEDPAGHVIVATCGRLWRIIIITYSSKCFAETPHSKFLNLFLYLGFFFAENFISTTL